MLAVEEKEMHFFVYKLHVWRRRPQVSVPLSRLLYVVFTLRSIGAATHMYRIDELFSAFNIA